ncbi:hypothetical protein CC2G_005075 [Coprinopsis cinerea AmutBmut pab1-1]|nr:hypothetical protein CC2G_005075 [Coprinopsis cinerea AmutBmut pab1-1]
MKFIRAATFAASSPCSPLVYEQRPHLARRPNLFLNTALLGRAQPASAHLHSGLYFHFKNPTCFSAQDWESPYWAVLEGLTGAV